jgi:hypothetical protein
MIHQNPEEEKIPSEFYKTVKGVHPSHKKILSEFYEMVRGVSPTPQEELIKVLRILRPESLLAFRAGLSIIAEG